MRPHLIPGKIGDGNTREYGDNRYNDQEFDDYIKNLFREIAPGSNFIVGMGDNLPFDADINRVGRVVELIDKYGRLPIEV